MFSKIKITALALFVSLFISQGMFDLQAHAITVGGENYERFLTATTINGSQKFGYWRKMNKYTTAAPGNLVNETFVDEDFEDYDVTRIFAMGTTQYAFGPVNSGVINVFGENGEDLLSATLVNPGTFSTNFYNNVSISALYNVTSGLWATDGLVGDTIFADFAFRSIDYNGKDIHAANGTFNFYRNGGGGNTTIPEPATVTLLATSLAGLWRARSKKKAAILAPEVA